MIMKVSEITRSVKEAYDLSFKLENKIIEIYSMFIFKGFENKGTQINQPEIFLNYDGAMYLKCFLGHMCIDDAIAIMGKSGFISPDDFNECFNFKQKYL